jgi:hypothetical protein
MVLQEGREVVEAVEITMFACSELFIIRGAVHSR